MKIQTLTINGNTFEISDPAVEENEAKIAENSAAIEQLQANSVQTSAQTLTEEQKAQARANIGAAYQGVSGIIIKGENAQIDVDVISSVDETGYDRPFLVFNGADDRDVVLSGVADGINDSDAATVGQLNAAVGDIETALDSIIAIQESLIGGASE